MPRAADYERKEASDGDELGELAAKLTADLHANLHLLASVPVLSPRWCAMAELAGRLSVVTDMESKLPRASPNATLWETEELALRYILEDGKLNLCLQNMVAYRAFQRETDLDDADLFVKHADALGWAAEEEGEAAGRALLRAKADLFEKGMGATLKHVWFHAEALQTADINLLLGHVATVLREAVRDSRCRERIRDYRRRGDLHARQEVVVVHYLRAMTARIDDMLQFRFMTILKDERLVDSLVDYLDAHHASLKPDDLLAASQALSDIVDTDDFQTFQDNFIADEALAKAADFRANFLGVFLDDFDARKTIQPLLRFVQDCRYSARK